MHPDQQQRTMCLEDHFPGTQPNRFLLLQTLTSSAWTLCPAPHLGMSWALSAFHTTAMLSPPMSSGEQGCWKLILRECQTPWGALDSWLKGPGFKAGVVGEFSSPGSTFWALILVFVPSLCYHCRFCQKCRWQVTAKHTYMALNEVTLSTGARLNGVHTYFGIRSIPVLPLSLLPKVQVAGYS